MAPSMSELEDMFLIDDPFAIFCQTHPKKEGSEEFRKWYQSFTDATSHILKTPSDVLVVSDGGVTNKEVTIDEEEALTSNKIFSASAYKVVHGPNPGDQQHKEVLIKEDVFTIGQCLSFDAEVHALCKGINEACEYLTTKYHTDKETQ